MLCHKYRCLFIHQRKCAGSSIREAFRPDVTPGQPEWDFGGDGSQGSSYKDWPANYSVFAVVRNPWDRFISGWRYLASTRDRPLRDVLMDLPKHGHDYRHLTRTQCATLFDNYGRAVYDSLLRYETLQLDFDKYCKRIGKPPARLPHVNSTERTDYIEYYDEETKELVAEIFREDITRFGYKYGH